ncbi:hypothetical protein SK128_011732 [Halocaridina rubra]|uniref:Condensation domain-containing protein n=1 Tax=Halocaridina rubra TaxID=373956 RepID=A0AAN8XI19_HALRR
MAKLVLENKPSDPYFNGQWLRKASTWEKVMEIGHRHGCFLIWYQLNLKSKSPLKEEDVRLAVTHLYRKTPNLGTCLAKNNGEMWLKRASNPDVDFKVLRDQTVEEVRESLRRYRYKSETGPLFCTRLLLDSSNNTSDTEDLDPDFPFTSSFFLGTHHGITDGTSNMHIMGFFISLLNDVISKKPIQEHESLGVFVTEEETLQIIQKKKYILESDPSLMQKISREKEIYGHKIPLLISGFKAPEDKMRTVSLVEILDRATTLKFIQKCRQEKVTIHSAFTALSNVALVDCLVENGVIQDSYCLQNFHLVNLRRYWGVKIPIALGCHIGGPLTKYTDTPRNLGDRFWDYARSLHQNLKEDIASAQALTNKAFHDIMNPGVILFTEKFLLDSSKKYKGDFVVSNMGDVTSLVTEGGEYVKISHVMRSTTIHLIDKAVTINIHTFRGRFTMIFDYNAGVVRKEDGEKFCSQIIKRILSVLT